MSIFVLMRRIFYVPASIVSFDQYSLIKLLFLHFISIVLVIRWSNFYHRAWLIDF